MSFLAAPAGGTKDRSSIFGSWNNHFTIISAAGRAKGICGALGAEIKHSRPERRAKFTVATHPRSMVAQQRHGRFPWIFPWWRRLHRCGARTRAGHRALALQWRQRRRLIVIGDGDPRLPRAHMRWQP